MPRMALCGGLRIGVESMEPNTPPLVMVKTPPCKSSKAILPDRAFVCVGLNFLFDGGETEHVAIP